MYIKSMSYLHECVSPIFSIPDEAKVFNRDKFLLESQLHLKGRCRYLE